jgi:hypothetical protein
MNGASQHLEQSIAGFPVFQHIDRADQTHRNIAVAAPGQRYDPRRRGLQERATSQTATFLNKANLQIMPKAPRHGYD